jgi:hypothetical protein
LREETGMSRMTKLILSTAAGIAALPFGYAANLLICAAASPIGNLLAAGNALTLIP